jgi:phosphoribosylformimino-5-aminoimidazole carboxamide ribotide isomerase
VCQTLLRLFRGDYAQAQTYSAEPVAMAKRFFDAGIGRIHVVDLDAARGSGNNRESIRRIIDEVPVEIEVGGGIRNEPDIEELLAAGVRELIVGTVLARDPERVAGWVATYGDVFIASIDAREGMVSVAGWEKDTGIKDTELARMIADLGIGTIVYTSISHDGTLEGPDIEATNRIAEESGVEVVLSGGVSCAADVRSVVDRGHRLITGIITGKAIYEGTLELSEAMEAARGERDDGS